MISRNCGSQYLAPSINACHVGWMNELSCSTVGCGTRRGIADEVDPELAGVGFGAVGVGLGRRCQVDEILLEAQHVELALPRPLGGEHHAVPSLAEHVGDRCNCSSVRTFSGMKRNVRDVLMTSSACVTWSGRDQVGAMLRTLVNPATGLVIESIADATPGEVGAKVTAAVKAGAEWRALPRSVRSSCTGSPIWWSSTPTSSLDWSSRRPASRGR